MAKQRRPRILLVAYIDRFQPSESGRRAKGRDAGYWWEVSMFVDLGDGPQLKVHEGGDKVCKTLNAAEKAVLWEYGLKLKRLPAPETTKEVWTCAAFFAGEFGLSDRTEEEVLAEVGSQERNPDHSRRVASQV